MQPRLDLLEELADYLESPAVTCDNFDMILWRKECGTRVCAIGYAESLSSWRASGLRLFKDAAHCGIIRPMFINPHGLMYLDYEAIAKILHIGEDDAEGLFSPDCYYDVYDPKEVVTSIRRFIDEKREGA